MSKTKKTMPTKHSALECITEWSSHLFDSGKLSLSKAYCSTLRSLFRYCDNPSLSLCEIFTSIFLYNYHAYLKGTGIKNSTINFYMKTLRSIYNRAVENFLIVPVHALFRNLIVDSGPTDKRALPSIVIARLISGDLSLFPALALCRDYFLLMIFLQGISFIDLVHLRKGEVRKDKIVITRWKTNKTVTIDIIPLARLLLDKLASRDPHSSYFFPLITLSGTAGFQQYQSLLHHFNIQLKEVARVLGIEENLTSHVARHSWATIAYHNGTQIGLVSQGMGHHSEQMTRTYLSSFTPSQLGEVNRVVLRSVLLPIVNNEIEGVTPEAISQAENKLQEINRYLNQNSDKHQFKARAQKTKRKEE